MVGKQASQPKRWDFQMPQYLCAGTGLLLAHEPGLGKELENFLSKVSKWLFISINAKPGFSS